MIKKEQGLINNDISQESKTNHYENNMLNDIQLQVHDGHNNDREDFVETLVENPEVMRKFSMEKLVQIQKYYEQLVIKKRQAISNKM